MWEKNWVRQGVFLVIAYLLYLWSWNAAFAENDRQVFLAEPISQQLLMQQLTEYINVHQGQPNIIGHLLIDDRVTGISQATWLYVKSALDYYKKVRPSFIILELNTPGGEVFAAQLISDALKELDIQHNIPVVAYINNWAISAGAMLAYSCRFIAVVKDASMGAAEPLTQDASGQMEQASEKINSAMRVDFANRAAFFDRNPLIAEAMVDKDLLLVLRDHQVIKLDNASEVRVGANHPDTILAPKGKLLTLSSAQMLALGVADIFLPPMKLQQITPEEQETGNWPAAKSALFQQPFFEAIPHATVHSFKMNWKTRFFSLLVSPTVASLLFMGMIIGLYIEFTTPGFGLGGAIGLTCLFLIILSSFALDIGNWLELILLGLGLVILLVELLVLPTFGVLGLVGLILFLIGLGGLMIPGIDLVGFEWDSHTFNAAGEAVLERLGWLSGAFVVSLIVIAFLMRYITPQLLGWTRLVLVGNEQKGYIAGNSPHQLPQSGTKGVVAMTLRPAGKILVNGVLYDALSLASLIEKGTPIIISHLDGSTIMVAVDPEFQEKH